MAEAPADPKEMEADEAGCPLECWGDAGLPTPCCWDEEDNGVPPFCADVEACPFHPDNPVTNNNLCCHIFGNVGYKHCGEKRRSRMGLAMWTTLAAIFITSFGALSLSRRAALVRAAPWVVVSARNDTTGAKTIYFLGLASIVADADADKDRVARLAVNYIFGRLDPHRDEGRHTALTLDVINACEDAATATQFGALMTAATLIFALLGTINRMKFSSDSNCQKTLGLMTDSWGALSLIATLANFNAECISRLPESGGGLKISTTVGAGMYCYLACACAAVFRALAHWLTPTPGNGSDGACLFAVPPQLAELLDLDGDGRFNWADSQVAFKRLKEVYEASKLNLPAFPAGDSWGNLSGKAPGVTTQQPRPDALYAWKRPAQVASWDGSPPHASPKTPKRRASQPKLFTLQRAPSWPPAHAARHSHSAFVVPHASSPTRAARSPAHPSRSPMGACRVASQPGILEVQRVPSERKVHVDDLLAQSA
ncbi:hypothetical protein M885DRAFT_505369 [Pelagophyceae sp. CCMP2097]|nr:hypothetical protein M885DRAFT_505369 [Pelagophyceae sp. CCMP2097]|mmetsp:Transcript_5679/g.17977  ORF Transcript_5679/g.17977 Transcript_5679/m.17977 type:complete len:484 (+) Transcript_5679:32-1483(+)